MSVQQSKGDREKLLLKEGELLRASDMITETCKSWRVKQRTYRKQSELKTDVTHLDQALSSTTAKFCFICLELK